MSGTEWIDSPRITINQAADRLRLHVSTVWRWCMKGCRGRRLTSVVIGGRRHIFLADLEAFLAAGLSADSPAHEDPRRFSETAQTDDRHLDALLDSRHAGSRLTNDIRLMPEVSGDAR